MPDLSIEVTGAEVVPYAVAPLLSFRLQVSNLPAEQPIHTVVLRCQLQLEVTRRSYTPEEEGRLRDLFGDRDRWGQTLRSMLWTHASVVLPRFTGASTAELAVPCSFDFNLAATKYFHGLDQGEIPIAFLFSGSVFYQSEDGSLQVAPISWTKEARWRLPVRTWRELIDMYYPNQVTLHLRRDAFERLYRYKRREGIPTWEQALERLLPDPEVSPV